MINILSPGTYYGELALLREDNHRTATIAALEATETLAVSASAFHRLCETRPAVERTLTALLGKRVDELSQRLLGVDVRRPRPAPVPAPLRAQPHYSDSDGLMVISLTQSQLADLTGGTRPTVNQVLHQLVDQGIVEVSRGKVQVLDAQRLYSKCGY